MINGIDISKYQAGLDLERVKRERNPQFIIMRLSVGGSGKDTKVEDFYTQATALGIPVGFYVFGNARTQTEAFNEAKAALKYLEGKHTDMPIFYDVESDKMMKLGKRELTDIVTAFCEVIEEAGYMAGVYTSLCVFEDKLYDEELPYEHWVADWRYYAEGEKPELSSGNAVDIWQTGSDKHYQDDMEVDTDICYTDYFSDTEKPADTVTAQLCAEIKDIIKSLDNIIRALS